MDRRGDVQHALRRKEAGTFLAIGAAVCPLCFKLHTRTGLEHLRKPWSEPPRCIDCGTPLRMPEHQHAA